MVGEIYTGIRFYHWFNLSMIHARDSNTGIVEVQIYNYDGGSNLLKLNLLKYKHL